MPAGATNFTLTHVFDDNKTGNPNQVNSVQISVMDVHTGVGSALTSITVHDVTPTLINLVGNDLGSSGIVTITGNVGHPGGSPLTLTINWEDTVQVIQNVPQGNFSIQHFYDAPPDEANPSAPITITVSVASDTNLSASAGHTSAVSGLGPVGGQLALFYLQQQTTIPHFGGGGEHVDLPATQPIVLTFTTVQFDLHAAQGEGLGTTKPVVALRSFDPAAGAERGIVLLPVDVLNNLTALFAKLPDDHYRLYYVEQGTERMIMDVVVRHGKPIDPTDDSEGTQDRPPTSHLERADEQENQFVDAANEGADGAPVAARPVELLEVPNAADEDALPMPADFGAPEAAPVGPPSDSGAANFSTGVTIERTATARYRALFAPAVAAVAASSLWSGDRWAQRVDESLAKAPADALTKPARLRRRLQRMLDRPTTPK